MAVASVWSDFNDDGFADLAVGVPAEDVGGITNAGAVNVLYGSGSGLTGTDAQLFTQDSHRSPPSLRKVIGSALRWRSATSTVTASPTWPLGFPQRTRAASPTPER